MPNNYVKPPVEASIDSTGTVRSRQVLRSMRSVDAACKSVAAGLHGDARHRVHIRQRALEGSLFRKLVFPTPSRRPFCPCPSSVLPASHELDLALLTTYTLDLEVLLALPLSLVARSNNGLEDLLSDPLFLLEALRRARERIHVFEDRAIIAIPRTRREL